MLLLLAATFVALVATLVSARQAVRGIAVVEITLAPLTTVGVATSMSFRVRRPARHCDGVVRICDGRTELLSLDFGQLDEHDHAHASVVFDTPGLVDELVVDVMSAGIAGLVWMCRLEAFGIETIAVAPSPIGPAIDVDAAPSTSHGVTVTQHGPKHGDIDGVRLWRDGDGDSAVHWPSTLRSGSMIVHDRQASLDQTWLVEVTDTVLDQHAAARLVHTLLEGLRLGHDVVLRRRTAPADASKAPPNTVGYTAAAANDSPVASPDAARRIGAELIGPRARLGAVGPRRTWTARAVRIGSAADTFTTIAAPSRWLTALASMVSLGMLAGALDAAPATTILGGGGLMLGAFVSIWSARRGTTPWWLRAAIIFSTLTALGYIASTVGGISGLAQALRGPMPDLLMLLLVIHGFEVADRRTLRVHQAISGVVVAYATGLRIDDRVGLWLAAWGMAIVAAVRISTWRTSRGIRVAESTWRRAAKASGGIPASCAATLAVLLIVPVPDGPARLGLPALSNNAPSAPTAGGLAGPSGAPPAPSDGTRGSLGEVGGYPGFTETMDTSVRGDLGDEIVLRVRAPKPDL